jgi:hypothetical protein
MARAGACCAAALGSASPGAAGPRPASAGTPAIATTSSGSAPPVRRSSAFTTSPPRICPTRPETTSQTPICPSDRAARAPQLRPDGVRIGHETAPRPRCSQSHPGPDLPPRAAPPRRSARPSRNAQVPPYSALPQRKSRHRKHRPTARAALRPPAPAGWFRRPRGPARTRRRFVIMARPGGRSRERRELAA